jgi:glutathione synthase/RimK-type ligase-like ATP-grasp enzyme
VRWQYDLVVAWSWEHDAMFLETLRRECADRVLSLLEVTPDLLPAAIAALEAGELGFAALLDRAWDTEPAFCPLAAHARNAGARLINDPALAERAWDKATMHLEFISAGVHTPHTVLLAPYAQEPELPEPDLAPLGDRFLLKPAHGGGGIGVQRNLSTWKQVQRIRRRHPDDKYLAQAWVTARLTPDGPEWYRVIYAGGEVLPFWWGVASHAYRTVTAEQETRHALAPLREAVATIASVCGLDVFSTEIARRDGDGELVSVDYVNDPIDLRPRSLAADGVPDDAIRTVAARIAAIAAEAKTSCVPD